MDAALQEIIIKIVVGICTALITTFIIPAIARWYTSLGESKLKRFIDNAVDAAEQIYGSKTATKKKAYVISMVKSRFKHLKMSDEALDMLIEASVSRVSAAVKQAKEVAAIQSASTQGAPIHTETATETQNGLIVASQESNKYTSDGDKPITLQ